MQFIDGEQGGRDYARAETVGGRYEVIHRVEYGDDYWVVYHAGCLLRNPIGFERRFGSRQDAEAACRAHVQGGGE